MKYVYKTTGTIVESGIPLDSAIYSPVIETKVEKVAAETKTTEVKKTVKRTSMKAVKK
jgi:hypothetical protein